MKIELKKIVILIASMVAGSMVLTSQSTYAGCPELERCADKVIDASSDFIGFVAQGVSENAAMATQGMAGIAGEVGHALVVNPCNFMFDAQLAHENPKILVRRWLGTLPIIGVGYLLYKGYYKTLAAVAVGALAYAGYAVSLAQENSYRG